MIVYQILGRYHGHIIGVLTLISIGVNLFGNFCKIWLHLDDIPLLDDKCLAWMKSCFSQVFQKKVLQEIIYIALDLWKNIINIYLQGSY